MNNKMKRTEDENKREKLYSASIEFYILSIEVETITSIYKQIINYPLMH